MTEQNKQYEQQILFTEDSSENESGEIIEQAVILDNLDYQEAIDEGETELEVEPEKNTSVFYKVFWALFGIIVLVETILFIQSSLMESPFMGGLYTALIAMLSAIVGAKLVKEFSGLSQLKRQQDHRKQAIDILNQDSEENAQELCQSIHKQLTFDITETQEAKWQQASSQGLSDKELIQLYDIEILTKVDEKAIQDIAKYSSEAMALVALSPIALIDMLVMVWRNFKLIDKVAGLYGIKLGYWSRIKLIKQVFTNMVLVGASEILIDVGADALGADLLGKVSGRLAQGFGAGMLTARLGLNTIQVCRPLPFQGKKPRLMDIRKGLAVQIKNLLKNKVT